MYLHSIYNCEEIFGLKLKFRGIWSEKKTRAVVSCCNFTLSSGIALLQVLHTILSVTVHGIYDSRRPRTNALYKFFSKCACATGSFIFPFKVRMRNSTFHVLFWILSLCVCHTCVENRTFRAHVTKNFFLSHYSGFTVL